MENKKYLILGHGFTAKQLIQKIESADPTATIFSTSRKGSPKIFFNLDDSSTWNNIPQADFTFWTFPPEPASLVREFWKQQQSKWGRLIVIGSTGSILTSQEGQKVNEASPLDLAIERAKGETFLKNQGAILVLSAGIYGPGRNPLDWVKKGLVGKSKKWVNMIHVEDLAEILFAASQSGVPGKTYIASDGHPQQWDQVISYWEKKALLKKVPIKENNRVSKIVDNSQTIKSLQINLKFRNFADSVS